jgi:nitroreductase/dihydropteridine reductase
MGLLESLEWRYATKKMNGDKIPQDKLDRILQATKLAPSSYGLTPYQVIVIEDQELKERLVPACYGQPQLKDSSTVLVFAVWETINEESVEKYINDTATQRNIPIEGLNDFKNMMIGTINNMSEEQKTIWAQKQTYIGLGFSLVASALEGIDSTPMEGFIPEQVDEVLGLDELGLKSTLVLTLGYRDSGDYLSFMKKIRRDDDSFFIRR